MTTRPRKLGFVGAGNMAGALIKGVLAAGLHRAPEIWVSDPVASQRRLLRRRYGVVAAADNLELVRGAETIVLAVKPQILFDVLTEIRPVISSRQLFVSIAAGVRLGRIEEALGPPVRLVRVMPNTPALVGKGMSVLVKGARATSADVKRALRLFEGVGDAVIIDDEELLDPVTALSGSGPAYVYRFAEALIETAVRQGLSPDLASRLTFRTLEGAAAMLLETGMTPRGLREMVSSPGGTTVAGLAAMEQAGFVEAVGSAVAHATRRSRELGGR